MFDTSGELFCSRDFGTKRKLISSSQLMNAALVRGSSLLTTFETCFSLDSKSLSHSNSANCVRRNRSVLS